MKPSSSATQAQPQQIEVEMAGLRAQLGPDVKEGRWFCEMKVLNVAKGFPVDLRILE